MPIISRIKKHLFSRKIERTVYNKPKRKLFNYIEKERVKLSHKL